ncbi:surp module [Ancylostoma caninum]|uniref:Surp module n=1 Tax=Ancylostoma caninum TaxID=29170 RepID=A0A368GHN6_ANCCA|nr:surp module [Ancylostoma caninum]
MYTKFPVNFQDEDLLVFGYASRIYPADERSEYIAEERHLIESPNEPSLKIDRYDCRLLLSVGCDAFASSSTDQESCPTEDLEEEMCDEERYRDLGDETEQAKEEEQARPRKAEIGFDYGTNDAKRNDDAVEPGNDDSDSESEPFEPPPGIKLPLGLAVPDNQKQNHIIERTALFVVTKGPQMEIVIKAKQRNNTEQFGFLEFDHVLHPYYKYLSKLIREKKYTPNLSKHAKGAAQQTSDASTSGTNGEKKSSALAAIAENESDSDDSDCELHPSLLSGYRKQTRSPDLIDAADNVAGPRRRPASPSPPPVTAHRHDYDMSKSNDIYASLFKSLKQVSTEREEAVKRQKEQLEIKKHIMASAPPPPDEEYRAWWLSFYGTPCPYSSPQPMVPPPPDLQPIIASYAEFVARHGAEAEMDLRDRVDLQLHFMHPSSHHFSYYQHLVRMCQWELAQKLQEEPTTMEQIPKVSSSPALLTSVPQPSLQVEEAASNETSSTGTPLALQQKPFAAAPVSFSLAPAKDENAVAAPSLAVIEGPGSPALVDPRTLSPLSAPQVQPGTSSVGLILPPPVPPNIPSNTQLDRKEKIEASESEAGAAIEAEKPSSTDTATEASVLTSSSEATSEQGSADSPIAAMNRKQRRRLQDAFRVPVALPVGIVDPVAAISLADTGAMPKVSSSPALLTSIPQPSLQVEEAASNESSSTGTALALQQKPFAAAPVSFSLAPAKDENLVAAPSLAVIEGPGSPALVDPRTLSPLSVPQVQPGTSSVGLILPPPVPPNIPSNTQLDRKEKARIFMERLLNEKRVKKLKEQEEARIRELEAQKAEIERQLAEEEAKRKKTSLEMVDKLINRRIGALLGTVETKKPEEKERTKAKLPARLSDDEVEKDRDEMRKKRKKEKSKKHKHKKSRSRSRDRSKDRERRRRRRSSDSSDSDRESSRKRRKERR